MSGPGSVIHEKIGEYIVSYIKNRNLAAGDRLPAERDIGQRFGSSQKPVRHAIQNLINRGILTRVHGKGTFVNRNISRNLLTNRIGVLYWSSDEGFFSSSFYGPMLKGLEREANQAHKSLLFQSLNPADNTDPAAILYDVADQADGLLVMDLSVSLADQVHGTLAGLAKPVVVLSYEDVPDGVSSVVFDSVGNGKKMTRFLADLGHERIGVIGFVPSIEKQGRISPTSRNLIRGYRDALAETGMPVDEDLISTMKNFDDKETFLSLVRRPHPPTALFCLGDITAYRVYQFAQAEGIRIPDELTVAGIGDIAECAAMDPPLTTIHAPLEEMGTRALQLLNSRTGAAPDVLAEKVVLPGTIIKRGSHTSLGL